MKTIEWIFEGECIRCTSHAIPKRGYPVISRNGKPKTIARRILLRRHGALSNRIDARHTCDNRWCINPKHLLSGTRRDNIHDMISRGRIADATGEANGNVKLTESDVLAIRGSRELYKVLAARYGVSISTIGFVKTKRSWRNLD